VQFKKVHPPVTIKTLQEPLGLEDSPPAKLKDVKVISVADCYLISRSSGNFFFIYALFLLTI